MARRRWVRGVVWSGRALGFLLFIIVFVLVLVTESAIGRERVRRIAERESARFLLGSLRLGSLRFGPGCTLAVDSASLRDPDDSLLVSVGPVRATCALGALTRGRLVVTSVSVARPYVVARQSASGVWNWSRALRPDSSPPSTSTGPARVVVSGPVRVDGGTVVLEVPWAPPDSLRGAARERAIDAALGAPIPTVRRIGGALVKRRELHSIDFDAPSVRTGSGDTTAAVLLDRLSLTLVDPPIVVHRVAGRVTLVGSAADVDLPSVLFNASRARAAGRVDWSADGPLAIDARIVADTVALADLAPFLDGVPASGGGRLQLDVKSAGGTAPTVYRVSSADLRSTRSVIRGDLTLDQSASGDVTIRDAALDLAPLHSDLLRIVAPGALPSELRGALTARVVARGIGRSGALRIDALDASYVDEAVPGATSRLGARGALTLGADGSLSFSRLVVTAGAIDVRTLGRLVPSLSPFDGRLAGTVTLDSTLEHLRLGDADLRYAEGAAAPLRVTGGGHIDLGEVPRFDLRLRAQPFSPAALAHSYPQLAAIPTLRDARIELRGTASDLTFATTSLSDAGSASLAGRYSEGASGVAIRVTGTVRDLDPRAASGRASAPHGRITADIDVDLRGDSLTTLRGAAGLANVQGTLAGVTIEPSIARVTLTDARIVAESVFVATSAGTASARGALGRRPDVRDTVTLSASVSLAELAPLLRAPGAADSLGGDSGAAPGSAIDSTAGTVTAHARLVGSIDSLDADGELEALGLTSSLGGARRAHVEWGVAGIPSSPRGHASLNADSITVSGVHLSTASASARSDDGRLWRLSLATADSDRLGGAAAGSLSVRGDTVDVELDSLGLRLSGPELRLTRPTRIRREGDGTIAVDSLELRGSRGGLVALDGFYRDTGSVKLALDVRNATVFMPLPGEGADSARVLLDVTARLEGTARLPRASSSVRARVTSSDSLPVDSVVADVGYADDRVELRLDVHGGARRILAAHGTGPVHLSLAPAAATLLAEPVAGEISIDSLYLPDLARLMSGARATAGVLRTKLTISGTAREPRAVGTLTLKGGAAHIDALGLDVRDANVALDLTSDQIRIGELTARAGKDPEGRADLAGVVGIADSGRVDLRLRLSKMPVVRLPETAELDVTSDLRLAGPRARPTLTGSITVDRGVIRLPDMGSAGVVGVDDTAFVQLVDSLAPDRASGPSRPALQGVEIGDVRIVMGPNVWLRSAETSVQLGGEIAMANAKPAPGVTERQIVLRGKLVTQRGNYRLNFGAFTRSFELEQGSVQFTGEPELNPRLDITALYSRETSEQSQTSGGRAPKVRAHLGGTVERPVLTLSSTDTRLTQAELMNYLVTGQTNGALGDALDASLVTSELVASATGAVAQRLAGGMFDVVNVTPGSTSTDQDANQNAIDVLAASRLGVGKQLSTRLFIKVDAGLCALTGGTASNGVGQTLGVSMDYKLRRDVLGSVSSAPSTNGATCANQAAGRGAALTPRQWGVDFSRMWRF